MPLALLRTCAAPAVKIRLLARCRSNIDWEDVDSNLTQAMAAIVGGSESLQVDVRLQCQLAIDKGGCGIQTMGRFAGAFYVDAVTRKEAFVAEQCRDAESTGNIPFFHIINWVARPS